MFAPTYRDDPIDWCFAHGLCFKFCPRYVTSQVSHPMIGYTWIVAVLASAVFSPVFSRTKLKLKFERRKRCKGGGWGNSSNESLALCLRDLMCQRLCWGWACSPMLELFQAFRKGRINGHKHSQTDNHIELWPWKLHQWRQDILVAASTWQTSYNIGTLEFKISFGECIPHPIAQPIKLAAVLFWSDLLSFHLQNLGSRGGSWRGR